jgi:formiminoglutamate deiminase
MKYRCEWAWLGGPTATPSVVVEVRSGQIASIGTGEADRLLPGLTIPGLANAHSHAFHRALRGRTHGHAGDFWTWRDGMYRLADRLDPDSYLRLARAVFAEMVLGGVTCVGEFHYLHHTPSGKPYDDPNAMGHSLIAAASAAGLRITLLDACYLTSSVDGAPLAGPQVRFGDGSAAAWASRISDMSESSHARRGAAVHSVRAVPADQLGDVAAFDGPLHVHLSEQRAENDACRKHYGRTPTEVLDDAGILSPRTTAVHATHLTDLDRTLLGDTDTAVCLCPTTERDLADGIGTARPLADAGSPLCLGSDSHAVIDLFEEARAVELDERLRTERRGHFPAATLLDAATVAGHRSLGWTDAGRIEVGARADLVTVRLDSVRTAGVTPGPEIVFAASAADVTHVVVDGRVVVSDGRHATLDVERELVESIGALW